MDGSDTKPVCGIVMPISAIDDCDEHHWVDVKAIVDDAIRQAGFEPNLVSNADEVGIIQSRIVQNLYSNELVVCDVSAKNANVMFELGLRLAFDKPTIIIKDNKTTYSFDTSPIEHIEYPRDLRYNSMVAFKEKLSQKIKSTSKSAKTDENYSPFLKHFGQIKAAKLDSKEVSQSEFILEQIKELQRSVDRLSSVEIRKTLDQPSRTINVCLGGLSESEINDAVDVAEMFVGKNDVDIQTRGKNHKHILVSNVPDEVRRELQRILRGLGGRPPGSRKNVASAEDLLRAPPISR